MFTNLSKPMIPNSRHPRINWRAVGDIAGDLIGAASVFATGYILLLAGHGFGLNWSVLSKFSDDPTANIHFATLCLAPGRSGRARATGS
jgi:hypothetical protein